MKIIKRRDILKAIRTERLKDGHFIERNFITEETLPNCKVCAVGAVLRNCGVKDSEIAGTAAYITCRGTTCWEGDEFNELKGKRFLNALSVKFEKLANTYGCGKKTKEILCRFVKRHFPKQIKVEL